ncbi:hypothetical protein ACB098_04G057300 [Castanea mollissima]
MESDSDSEEGLWWSRGSFIGKRTFVSLSLCPFSISLLNEKRILDALTGCPHVIQSFALDITATKKGDTTRSILIGLKHVHEHGFVHCDIKPDNILLVPSADGFDIKVADFGRAKRRFLGDIWPVGCTVLMMLTGEPPWDSALVSDIISHVAYESPPIPSYISKAAEDFLRGWLLCEESIGENDS